MECDSERCAFFTSHQPRTLQSNATNKRRNSTRKIPLGNKNAKLQHLEATLRNQLTNAFDFEIFDGLRDRTTNVINQPIPTIIKYLFEEYGELSPEELLQKEDEVKQYTYDTTFPVSSVFNEILHLKDLYELTGSTLSEDRMIRLAYSILGRAQVFCESLISWNNTADNAKTWNNFQAHSEGVSGPKKGQGS